MESRRSRDDQLTNFIGEFELNRRVKRQEIMGQKSSPTGFRTGITRGWQSTWFAGKSDYGTYLVEDQKIRDYMKMGIGQYLTSATKMCDRTLEALSGSDTKKMKEAAEEMKAHLLTLDEVKRAKVELMSKFGIDS